MRLFVSNLSFEKVGELELSNLFSPYGDLVDCRLIMTDGKSRGYGFVQFDDDEAGRRAMQELDGTTFEGRCLGVKLANERSKPDASKR